MQKEYDVVYSLGRDCACATYMKKNGLRVTSGPFDWLTNASFEARFELILNDFKDFLNRNYLETMPRPCQFPPDKNNEYYKDKKNGLYFWHDFPADESFEEAYPVVLQKYRRRINRFYKNIREKKRVLLIWFSQIHNTPDETVIRYCEKVCWKFNKDIDFLIIEHTENLQNVKVRRISENIIRYNCHAQKKSPDGTPLTQGNEELVMPIFAQYELYVPWCQKIFRRFVKLMIILVCCLLPMKKWRKNLRKNSSLFLY